MKTIAAKARFQEFLSRIVRLLSVFGNFLWKNKRVAILSSLVLGVIWLVASSWFNLTYAVPHTSMFVLGVLTCLVCLFVLDSRKSSNRNKFSLRIIVWLLIVYFLLPFIARRAVINKGRYWATEKDGVWIYEGPSSLGSNRETSYPHLSFFEKVKDPFNLPGQKWNDEGFVWEGETTTLTTEVEGFLLTIKTEYRATANEDEKHILLLRQQGLSSEMIKERISKEFVPSVIARIIEVSEQCKLDLETEVVTGFSPVSPLRRDIIFREESFTCTYKLKPMVL